MLYHPCALRWRRRKEHGGTLAGKRNRVGEGQFKSLKGDQENYKMSNRRGFEFE